MTPAATTGTRPGGAVAAAVPPSPATSRLKRRARMHLGISDAKFALSIVAVIIAINLSIIGYPLILLFQQSLFNTNPALRLNQFVGAANYVSVWFQPQFLESLATTLRFVAVATIATTFLALVYALVMNEKFFGRGVYRLLILLPWAVSEVSTAVIWGLIYNPNIGQLNGLLHLLGITSQNVFWLSASHAIDYTALAFAWHWAPVGAFFFLASLQTVSEDLYKAAKLDGSGPVDRFVNITMRHMKYALIIVLLLITAQAFTEFDLVYTLTAGGPGTSSTVLSILLFQYNFLYDQYGLAAAMSFIMILITTILSLVYFYFLTLKRSKPI